MSHIKIILLCYLLSTTTIWAQQKAVVLIEKKLPKRTILYAKNNTDKPQNIFLKVNPTGYRKSSSRPIIKTIPPASQSEMITLIPLKDVESSYTYNLIINEEPNFIEINRSEGPKKEANVADIMDNELVIFTKKDCEKCSKLLKGLHEKHIAYREINVDTKDRFYQYFWERLKKDGYEEKAIIAPVIVQQGVLKYPIKDVSAALSELIALHETKKEN